MNNNKENLIKLLKLVDEISKQPGNEWFKRELDRNPVNKSMDVNSTAIEEIYEYCIKVIIKDHAQKFYSDFKLLDIKERLIEDFIRMEKFRREDNFEGFCLAAYQQLEAITNSLAEKLSLLEYLQQNKDIPALHMYDRDTKTFVRKGNQTIGRLIFTTNENAKILDFISAPINKWFFNHKLRLVIYVFYFNTEIRVNADLFERVFDLGNYLHQGRNLNHRGVVQTKYQQDILDDLIPNQHKYYFKFLGFLEDFTTRINYNL